MKKIVLIANLFFVFLFSSCDLFNAKLGDYFDEYTNNAAIELHEFDASYPIVSGAENLPSTSGDKTIKFTLRNPRRYTLDLSQLGLTGSPDTDYTLTQSDDKNSILLTLKESYLQTIDADQTAGADKLSVTIEIVDSVSLRAFEPYTVDFIVNTPPPAVTNAALYTSGGKWVMAFEIPVFTNEHKDIVGLTVNGTSFAIDNSSGSVATLPAGLTKTAPASLFDAESKKVSGLSASTIYYQTDTIVTSEKSVTISLVDNHGLTSSIEVHQAGLDSILLPVITAGEVVDGTTGKRTVTITANENADIYYTLDESDPQTRETEIIKKYTSEFDIYTKDSAVTVKAIAVKEGYVGSPIVTQVFTKAGQVDTPSITGSEPNGSGDVSVTLLTTTDDATIYYTKDGSDPTTSSPKYTGEFKINIKDASVTVKALAVKDGLLNSMVGDKVFSKAGAVAVPTVKCNGTELTNGTKVDFSKGLTFECDTDDATISYKFSGDSGYKTGSSVSTIPAGSTSVTVKAIKAGMVDSAEQPIEFSQAQVATPTIEGTIPDGNGVISVTIETVTTDATIYYTTDGSTPTVSDTEYKTPFTENVKSNNMTVKAIAVKDGLLDSEIGSKAFSKAGAVAVPTVKCNGTELTNGTKVDFSKGLTFECSTAGATISYKFSADSSYKTDSSVATIPDGSTSVAVKATKDGMVDSEVQTTTFTQAQVAVPTVEYDGNELADNQELDFSKGLTFECSTAGATISYKFSGDSGYTANSSVSTIPDGSTSVTVKATKVGMTDSEDQTIEFSQAQVAVPTVKYDGNELADNQELDFSKGLTFKCSTAGATISYKFGDSDYKTGSSVLTIPDGSTSVAVKATKDGMTDSAEQEITFTQVTVAKPTIATDGAWDGATGERTVTIETTTDDATIYYTKDGNDPTTASTKYTGSFEINTTNSNVTINAIAVKEGYVNSSIVTEAFAQAEQVEKPTITVADNGTVTMSTTNGASFAYTTDGNDPTTGSQYDSDSKPKLTTNTTIKAIAYKDGMLNSNIGTGYYIVEAYADGTNGNDNATGYDENSPVQTFATAKAKLTTGSGTIWVMDTLEADTNDSWSANTGKTITVKRYKDNTLAIVNVAEGNSLALSDITLDGQGGVDGLDGNVTATTRMVTSSGTLELGLGAIIQNGNIGGVSVYGGTFTMNDGSIQYNKGSEHGDGGGVYVNAGEFKMLGGTISNNTATSYGGGVFVNTGEFKMSGGTISNNTGNYSGGVHVSTTGKFEMSDGTISENTATSKGGGIYLKDEGAKLKLRGNPQITGNTADGNKKNIEFTNNTTSSPIQITGALDGSNIGLSPISTDEGDVLAVSGDNYTIQVSDVGAFSLDAAPDGVALSLEGSGASATIKLVGPASNDFTIDAYGGIKYTGTATGVVIPESINGTPVTKIGEKAFYENTTITNVVIPDTVTKIGSTAFRDCENLTNVTFGENVKEIGGQAFLYTKITSVNLPESLEIIGSQAFSNLALASIIIPDSVITIEDEAFYKNKFSTIDIPKNVESIGSQAFCYNNSLATITVVGLPTGSSAYFIVDDNVLYNKAKTELVLYPAKKEGSTFSIPSDVTRINGGAFTDSAYLENVFIPRTVEVIEREAFAFCSKLKSITLPKEVKEVENYTFRHTPVYAEGDCSSTGFDDSWDWDCTYITNCELSTDVYPYVVSVTKSDATYINPDNKTLDAPCREGYTFKGWSTDGSTVLGSGSADYLRNADYGTYYAVWEEN